MRLPDLSLSVKIPIRVTVLALATAFAVTMMLLWREYDELRSDLAKSSDSLAALLSTTLVAPLTHDDLWRAYEIVRAPVAGKPGGSSVTPRYVTVLDTDRRVYVSNDPVRFPPGAPAQLLKVMELADRDAGFIELPDGDLAFAKPITADGVELGVLVLGYSNAQFHARYVGLLRRALIGTAAVLLLILPLSWIYARRTATPLVRLAGQMEEIGRRSSKGQQIERTASGDELERVNDSFRRMVHALEEKERLERQVVSADRLAAIGRLAAGVAHEINNPLGGMLNALNTYRRHGQSDPVASRTAELLERGLLQIRNTVTALLVEAKASSHPLTREDIEDVRTLALTDDKPARLRWQNGVAGPIALPSTLVRQILLNLLLNAEHAVPPGGEVECHVESGNGKLHIVVKNEGAQIPRERIPHLFEPFEAGEDRGLGLWVTYQIVRELGGSIEVQSDHRITEFDVCLPIRKAA